MKGQHNIKRFLWDTDTFRKCRQILCHLGLMEDFHLFQPSFEGVVMGGRTYGPIQRGRVQSDQPWFCLLLSEFLAFPFTVTFYMDSSKAVLYILVYLNFRYGNYTVTFIYKHIHIYICMCIYFEIFHDMHIYISIYIRGDFACIWLFTLQLSGLFAT